MKNKVFSSMLSVAVLIVLGLVFYLSWSIDEQEHNYQETTPEFWERQCEIVTDGNKFGIRDRWSKDKPFREYATFQEAVKGRRQAAELIAQNHTGGWRRVKDGN